MQKMNWRFRDVSLEPDKIVEFAKNSALSTTVATVLMNRGITNHEELKEYIGKPLSSILNPLELPDMEKAAKRVIEAVNNDEKITIYGDYDCDGVTSTVLLYSFLRELGANVDYFIPDRNLDGYGLNIKAINKISKGGTKLLITVDCGIASCGEVLLAKSQKMEVIVTDHHTCSEKLPEALAVVNPKRPDSEYGFSFLAGVGVAFKLALAVTKLMGKNTTECFNKYVELASIGTIADVVSLTGENRIIADRGMGKMRNSKFPGIRALFKVGGISLNNMSATTVSFSVSPRINAAGRMENANIAAELLLAETEEQAYELAVKLDEINKQRQAEEQIIAKEAMKMIKNMPDFNERKIIVLAKEGWNHGIIGIVASRICNMFYKPTIMISVKDGIGKGSGRSVEGINLFDALSDSQELLVQYGGHKLAAGLTIDMNDFDAFSSRINTYINKNYPEDTGKILNIDCTVPSSFINKNSVKILEHFEPFGTDNEQPIFALRGAKITQIKTIGIDNKHLKMNVSINNKVFECVGFSFGYYSEYFKKGQYVDLAFSLDINTYSDDVQLILKDIK